MVIGVSSPKAMLRVVCMMATSSTTKFTLAKTLIRVRMGLLTTLAV
jgi:hypothetical protein